MKEYMGPVYKVEIYHNHEEFDQTKYGEDKIIRQSIFNTNIVTVNDSTLLKSEIKRHQLFDETDLVQYGQTENLSFESI